MSQSFSPVLSKTGFLACNYLVVAMARTRASLR
jgi:hypothetical protein